MTSRRQRRRSRFLSVAGLLALSACAGPAPPVPELPPDPAPLRGGPLSRPVEDPAAIDATFIIGMDHNAVPSPDRLSCTSYAGKTFPWCYAGHEGSDFLLAGGFPALDAGSAFVVAAAGGTVLKVEDGHYDRCHGRPTEGDVFCDGFEMKSNHVVIDHGGGLLTEYHHLMKGSMLVAVGEAVRCGQRLARIGSSGRSSVPHLHLNVLRGGARIDPFAGPRSQPETLWAEQPAEAGELPPSRCRE